MERKVYIYIYINNQENEGKSIGTCKQQLNANDKKPGMKHFKSFKEIQSY